MKKILLLLSVCFLLMSQFIWAQERNSKAPFVRYVKSTKAFEPTFKFDKKYIPDKTVKFNVELAWTDQSMIEAFLVFPEGIEIVSATDMGSGFSSLTKTIVGDTIKWKAPGQGGLSASQSPKYADIEIKFPASASGNQLLDCAFTSDVETVSSQTTVLQLSSTPKLVVSMSEWHAGVSQASSTISSGAELYVYNDGAQNLEISSFSGLNEPFSYKGTLPLIVEPQTSKQLLLDFYTEDKGIYENNVTINSNGGNESLLISGAAYNNSFALIDFNDGAFQFPPVGWTIENYNNTKGWYALWGGARLDDHPDGGKNSSAFITPPIDLSNSDKMFISFNISIYNGNSGYVDIEYSTDNKVSWKVFDSNISEGIGVDGDYYKSLSAITGEKVFFKIKGTCQSGYIDIDNIVLPNYYQTTTPPDPVSYLKPSYADNSVSTATNFKWEKDLYAKGYKLYFGATETLNHFIDVGDTSMYDANLESLETYYWKVVPYNEYGDAVDCPVWNFTTEEFIPTVWTDDTKLNTQITFKDGAKYLPKIDMTSKGESYITWFSGEYGNLNVRAQMLDIDGAEKFRRGGVVVSANKQASYISGYNNVVDNDDNLITAFVDIRNGLNEAFIYKMNAKGEMLWGENGISITSFEGRAYKTEVKKDSAGFIYVLVYIGTGENHNTMNYVFVKLNSDGEPVWSNDKVFTDEIPSWEVLPNGEIYTSTVVGQELYLNYYDVNMLPKFSAPVKVSNNPEFPPMGLKNVKLQADKNNGMYLVWQGASMLGGIIKWQYVNADETIALGAAGEYISTNKVRSRGYINLAYHEKTDKLFVSWNESSSATLNKGMYAQRMNNKGEIDFSSTGKVLIECGDSIAGTDAFIMKGDTILWYFSSFEPGTTWNNYLNVMFLDSNLNKFEDIGVVRYSSDLSNKPLDAVDFDNNMAVMVWDEDRDEQTSIFAQNLYYDGTMGYIGVDSLPPFVKRIEPLTNTKLLLTFNEALLKDSAEVASNYWFDNSSASIISSELSDVKKVAIQTEGLVEGNHKLYIKNITDTAQNTNILDSIEFYFVPDNISPELVLAKPVANNKVVVRFSEPIMESDLSDLANFVISGTTVSSIKIVTPEQVVLQTNDLVEGDYTLTIGKFTDYMGNEVTNESVTINYAANSGQELYFEEDFNDGMPETFKLFNLDKAIPIIVDFQEAWITAEFSDGSITAASTSYYDPADQANDWMVTDKIDIQKNAYLYWDAQALSPVYADGYQIWLSTTGSNPEDFKIMIKEISEEDYNLTSRFICLSDYGFGDEPVYIAFRNNSKEKYILTIDNIAVYTPKMNDMTISDHSMPSSAMGTSEMDVNVTVKALGIENITSFDLNWQFNGGVINTDRVENVNIGMGKYQNIIHPDKLILPEAEGNYELKIWTSLPNGVIDEDLLNDTISVSINVQQGYAQRLVTIEHFTNTSCGPCATNNPVLEELLATGSNADKVLHLSYHVWWPSDQDIFFVANPEDVVKRQQYYTVTSAPSVTVDGGVLMGPQDVTQEMINEAYVKPGLVKIEGEANYMIANQRMQLDMNLTNLSDFTNAQPAVFAAVAQTFDMAEAPGGNGETYFPGVMRDIVTSNTGDVLTRLDSTANNNFTYEFDLPNDFVESDAFIGIFIQDVASKEIYMSAKTAIKESYKLEFNVTYESVAVEGVNVTINDKVYTTNAMGVVEVNYLANNIYNYTITKDGYETIENSVEVNNADDVVNIELKPTSINSIDDIIVDVYPNPAKENINVVANEIIERVSIVNISGADILKAENNSRSANLSISHLESGLYYVIIETRNNKSTHKLVVK